MKTKLKILRAEKNITQEELARILNTNQKSISSWETGRAQPKPSMMQKIEDFFGVKKEVIFPEAFNYK